jgi:hypothetical protein
MPHRSATHYTTLLGHSVHKVQCSAACMAAAQRAPIGREAPTCNRPAAEAKRYLRCLFVSAAVSCARAQHCHPLQRSTTEQRPSCSALQCNNAMRTGCNGGSGLWATRVVSGPAPLRFTTFACFCVRMGPCVYACVLCACWLRVRASTWGVLGCAGYRQRAPPALCSARGLPRSAPGTCLPLGHCS